METIVTKSSEYLESWFEYVKKNSLTNTFNAKVKKVQYEELLRTAFVAQFVVDHQRKCIEEIGVTEINNELIQALYIISYNYTTKYNDILRSESDDLNKLTLPA